jgi:hypothetical protein
MNLNWRKRRAAKPTFYSSHPVSRILRNPMETKHIIFSTRHTIAHFHSPRLRRQSGGFRRTLCGAGGPSSGFFPLPPLPPLLPLLPIFPYATIPGEAEGRNSNGD